MSPDITKHSRKIANHIFARYFQKLSLGKIVSETISMQDIFFRNLSFSKLFYNHYRHPKTAKNKKADFESSFKLYDRLL